MKTSPRRVRPLLLLAAGASLLLLPAFTARGDDASKLAVIEEIFQLTHVDAMIQQTMKQMQAMQKAQIQKMKLPDSDKAMRDEVQDKVMGLIAERMSWDKLKPIYTKLYSENFTEEELAGSLAYYKSPAGQAMLTKMPALMTSAMSAMQQQMGDLAPEIQRITRETAMKYGDAAPGAVKP